MNTIPMINLSPALKGDVAARRDVAHQIDAACREIGFFAIKGPVSYTHLTLPTKA